MDSYSASDQFASIWNDFHSNTSCHGIPHIVHAPNKFKKAMWLISTLASLAGLLFNVYYLSNDFLSRRVHVVIEPRKACELNFPAVTVCCSNPFLKQNIPTSSLDILKRFRTDSAAIGADSSFSGSYILRDWSHPRFENHFDNCTEIRCDVPVSLSSAFPTKKQPAGNINDDKDSFNSLREEYTLTKVFLENQAGQKDQKRKSSGYAKEELIYDCLFEGNSCFQDFDSHYNNYFGNCFTFNWGRNSTIKLRKSSETGPKNGLSITFNIAQDQFIGEISQSAGLRVVVHDPMRMPFPEDDAILVSPSYLTHIGLTLKEEEKLGGKYGNCTNSKLNQPMTTIYEKLFGVSYDKKGCVYTCVSDEMLKSCSCTDISFPVSLKENRPPCSSLNSTHEKCRSKVWEDYESDKISCASQCVDQCSKIKYEICISKEVWPSANYLKTIESGPCPSDILNCTAVKSKSFGKFNVYFEEMLYTRMEEVPDYEVHTFFSDIGGVLGFYVGFSLLTCVEFLELGLDMLKILYNKLKPKKRNVRSEKVLRERFEVMRNEMFSQPLPGSVLEEDNLSMTFKSCKKEIKKMPQVD